MDILARFSDLQVLLEDATASGLDYTAAALRLLIDFLLAPGTVVDLALGRCGAHPRLPLEYLLAVHMPGSYELVTGDHEVQQSEVQLALDGIDMHMHTAFEMRETAPRLPDPTSEIHERRAAATSEHREGPAHNDLQELLTCALVLLHDAYCRDDFQELQHRLLLLRLKWGCQLSAASYEDRHLEILQHLLPFMATRCSEATQWDLLKLLPSTIPLDLRYPDLYKIPRLCEAMDDAVFVELAKPSRRGMSGNEIDYGLAVGYWMFVEKRKDGQLSVDHTIRHWQLLRKWALSPSSRSPSTLLGHFTALHDRFIGGLRRLGHSEGEDHFDATWRRLATRFQDAQRMYREGSRTLRQLLFSARVPRSVTGNIAALVLADAMRQATPALQRAMLGGEEALV